MAPTLRTTPGLVLVETRYVTPAHEEPYYELVARVEGAVAVDPQVFITRDVRLWTAAMELEDQGEVVAISWHLGSRTRHVAKKPPETVPMKVATAITVDPEYQQPREAVHA